MLSIRILVCSLVSVTIDVGLKVNYNHIILATIKHFFILKFLTDCSFDKTPNVTHHFLLFKKSHRIGTNSIE